MDMRKLRSFLIILSLVSTMQGCATVDIRSEQLQLSGLDKSRQERAQALIAQVKQDQFDRYNRLMIEARDVWKTTFIRWLTPIPQSDQLLQLDFELKMDKAEMRYLNGKQKSQVLGIFEGQTYVLRGNEKIPKKNRKIELYLAPVRDYFIWPFTLMNSNILVYDGEDELNSRKYHKIFATNGTFEPQSNNDQFILWINQETMNIDYIEFTLRDLMKSYRGAVYYQDFRIVNDMFVAHRLQLLDSINQEQYSHEFIVTEMKFN